MSIKLFKHPLITASGMHNTDMKLISVQTDSGYVTNWYF